jgi:hypothetical protein
MNFIVLFFALLLNVYFASAEEAAFVVSSGGIQGDGTTVYCNRLQPCAVKIRSKLRDVQVQSKLGAHIKVTYDKDIVLLSLDYSSVKDVDRADTIITLDKDGKNSIATITVVPIQVHLSFDPFFGAGKPDIAWIDEEELELKYSITPWIGDLENKISFVTFNPLQGDGQLKLSLTSPKQANGSFVVSCNPRAATVSGVTAVFSYEKPMAIECAKRIAVHAGYNKKPLVPVRLTEDEGSVVVKLIDKRFEHINDEKMIKKIAKLKQAACQYKIPFLEKLLSPDKSDNSILNGLNSAPIRTIVLDFSACGIHYAPLPVLVP